ARVPRLTAQWDLMAWLRTRRFVVPAVELDRPQVEARALPDGRTNYIFDLAPPPGDAAPAEPSKVQIGALRIREGQAHVTLAKLRADFNVGVATEDPPGGQSRLVAEARGTYAGQPVTARLVGGAVLNLRDAEHPWPVRLEVANGPTRLTLEGTLREPLHLAGADLRLAGEGPNMALLQPLTGVPTPTTPPFKLSGRLDYAAGRFRFMDARGQVGSSDIEGRLMVTIGREPPVVAAELHSRHVNLADLGGVVGAPPARPNQPGLTPEQRAEALKAQRSPRLLPTEPISVPRLQAAEVHVDYKADRIEGRGMPFDGIAIQADIENGVVQVQRVAFPVGRGTLAGRFTLAPQENGVLRLSGEINATQLDFARLTGAAGVQGAGSLGGVGHLEGEGRSFAEILGNGNGALTVVMVGGDLSAFLVDLSGLEFGKALFSAIGLPQRTRIGCLIGDFELRQGRLSPRTLLLDTETAVVRGGGEVDLRTERLDLWLRTESKHVTIGSLPTPIHIGGTLRHPTVGPAVGELAARAAAALGLGVVAGPLAVLPTLQLGVGERNACAALRQTERR
ncbi:MAG TPA: AsmA family protein, partial [Crenalkalicoccus sp.]|nr:AsmA family protein [Crenalkalicoccus sp.]